MVRLWVWGSGFRVQGSWDLRFGGGFRVEGSDSWPKAKQSLGVPESDWDFGFAVAAYRERVWDCASFVLLFKILLSWTMSFDIVT